MERTPKTLRPKGSRMGITVALSVVLVPAAAIAAVALARPAESVEAVEASTTIVAEVPTDTQVEAASIVIEPVSSTEEDLIAACTVDGLLLVESEASGEITDLQSAALDALRQLCTEAGFEIPGPPAPPPVIKTVTVVAGGSGTPSTAPPGGDDDDDHDDDHDEDDDEDEEDEEDEDDD